MENTRKNYDIIDLAKFIASIFILMMHSKSLASVSEDLQFFGVQLLTRWGVPFFFTISSYFLFSKGVNGNISKDQIFSYVKRLAILYFAWLLLNIPYVVYYLFLRGISNPVTWLSFFINLFFSSTFMGSWYLTSSIFSAIFIFILSKKIKTQYILMLSFLLYAFCVVVDTYSIVFSISLGFTFSNSIISGCVFYALGKIIAENKGAIKIKNWVLMVLFFLSYAFFYLEMTILKISNLSASTDTSLFLVPFAFFFVIFLLKINCKLRGSIYFRKSSTIIYCSHGTILLISRLILNNCLNSSNTCLVTLLTIILCAILVSLILHLDKKNKIKVIKYLI